MWQIVRHPAAQYTTLFLVMAVWSWGSTVVTIFTADRQPSVAVPLGMGLAAFAYLGIAFMGRDWKKGACWVLGDGAGALLGFYIP
jgi:hypothetical protein